MCNPPIILSNFNFRITPNGKGTVGVQTRKRSYSSDPSYSAKTNDSGEGIARTRNKRKRGPPPKYRNDDFVSEDSEAEDQEMLIKSEILSNSDAENEENEGIGEKGSALLGSLITATSVTEMIHVKNEPVDQGYEVSSISPHSDPGPTNSANNLEENRSLYVTYSPPRSNSDARTSNGDFSSRHSDQGDMTAVSSSVTGGSSLNSVIDTLSLRQELQLSQSQLSQQHLENGRLQRELADCQRDMAELKDQLSTRETQIANLANHFFDLSNQFMRVSHEFKRISQTLPHQGSNPRLQNGFL